jgi:tyrosine-protein kinase Etk/Wzc
MENQEKDILDVLLVLTRHKRFIFWLVAIVSVASVVYALLAPQYWTSVAVIRPVDSNEESSLQNTLGGLLGSGFSMGGAGFSGIDFQTVLESRTVSEDVIRKFNLIPYFKIKDRDSLRAWDKALMRLGRKMRKIDFDEKNGIVSIAIMTRDKNLSAEIANYYCDILDRYNLETRVTKGRDTRIFLEKRVNETKQAVDSLSLDMKAFMAKNHALDLDDQTEQIVGLYSMLATEKYKSDIELETASKFSDPSMPQVAQLRETSKILDRKIKEMENSGAVPKPRYLIGLDDYSDLKYQYTRLYLDLEVQKQVYAMLYPEYERAKIEEHKDIPTLQILDRARPAGFRVKPKRALLCVTNFILALFAAACLSICHEYLLRKKDKARLIRDSLIS